MTPREILEAHARGELSTGQAEAALERRRIEDLGYARIDHDRRRRRGFPEVIYGAGKTPQELLEISCSVLEHHQRLLVTRATDEGLALLKAELEERKKRKEGLGVVAVDSLEADSLG